jgi:hypothetical protein
MVVSHFLVILLIIGFRIVERFTDETLKVSLPIVIPLFATYTTLVVKYFIDTSNQVNIDSPSISRNFTFISFFIPTVFVVVILAIVLKQGIKPVSLESFAVMLGLGESIFGIYLGYIFKELFGKR